MFQIFRKQWNIHDQAVIANNIHLEEPKYFTAWHRQLLWQEYEQWKAQNNNGKGWHLKYYKGQTGWIFAAHFRKAMEFCIPSDRRCYSPFTVSLWRPWNINNCRSQRVFQQHQCEQLSLGRLWRHACKSRTPVTRIHVHNIFDWDEQQ